MGVEYTSRCTRIHLHNVGEVMNEVLHRGGVPAGHDVQRPSVVARLDDEVPLFVHRVPQPHDGGAGEPKLGVGGGEALEEGVRDAVLGLALCGGEREDKLPLARLNGVCHCADRLALVGNGGIIHEIVVAEPLHVPKDPVFGRAHPKHHEEPDAHEKHDAVGKRLAPHVPVYHLALHLHGVDCGGGLVADAGGNRHPAPCLPNAGVFSGVLDFVPTGCLCVVPRARWLGTQKHE
jgi:hypothetical protein